jgi:hypothetical protein
MNRPFLTRPLVWGLALTILLGVVSGCKQETELMTDKDPIAAPTRTPPMETPATLYGNSFTPATPPAGQVYDPNLHPRDIEQSTFRDAIERLLRKRLVPIDAEGWFHPTRSLTRGEALLWLYNLYQANTDPSKEATGSPRALPATGDAVPAPSDARATAPYAASTPSANSEDSFFRPLSKKLKLHGMLDGYDELLMNDTWPIQREELAALVWIFTNHAKGLGEETVESHTALQSKTVAPQAEGIVQQLKKVYGRSVQDVTPSYLLGINYLARHKQGDLYRGTFMKNMPAADPALDPQKPVTREEAAGLLDRIENDFHERVFINRKRTRSEAPTPPSENSRSYEEKTEETDPALPDSSQ